MVLRQQRVSLEIPRAADTRLELSLFENEPLVLVLTSNRLLPDGAVIRQGSLLGRPGSRVQLHIKSGRIAGEIITPEFTCQIRTLNSGVHVAQLLARPAGLKATEKAGSADIKTEVIQLTNAERAKYGVPGLQYNSLLEQSAQGHSNDMAQNDYFSHTSLDGRTPSDRITATGYPWNANGENIAAGHRTADEVVTGWINSPPHHDNMISDKFCDIGVGYSYNESSTYGTYWVQNFGRQQGVSTCPSAQETGPPEVVTGTARVLDSKTVELSGTVNPNGLATSYLFELGKTAAYGMTSPVASAGSGTVSLTVQMTASGLTPSTTYHFRLVAENAQGKVYGSDSTFTTSGQSKSSPSATTLLLLQSE